MSAMMPRKATPADAGRLGAAHAAAWRQTYAGILPEDVLAGFSAGMRAAMWAEILGNPAAFADTTAYLVEDGASVAGFGACGGQRDARLQALGFDAEIGAIYLLRAYQGRGLGRALMQAMAADLRARGHGAAALWVLRENAAARAFYRHLGGEAVAERQDRRGDADLVMVAYGWRDLRPLTGDPPPHDG